MGFLFVFFTNRCSKTSFSFSFYRKLGKFILEIMYPDGVSTNSLKWVKLPCELIVGEQEKFLAKLRRWMNDHLILHSFSGRKHLSKVFLNQNWKSILPYWTSFDIIELLRAKQMFSRPIVITFLYFYLIFRFLQLFRCLYYLLLVDIKLFFLCNQSLWFGLH